MESTKLERLKVYHGELLEQAQELALEQQIVSLRSLIEGTINADDPILSATDIARETGWAGVPTSASMPNDRIRGAYWPFFRTEMELSTVRAIGRILATTTETGLSILESLINYTINDGIQLQWQARDKAMKDDPRIKRAQQVLDLFLEKNKIIVTRQRELMNEAIPAGEALAILSPCEESGIPKLTIRSCDHLTEPLNVWGIVDYHDLSSEIDLDWSFGVATPPFQYEDVKGYFCQWYGVGDNWEYLPPERCIHVKLNVPRDVKRGLSDYYACYRNIQRARNGFSASAEGATLQSSIAYIEKFKQGTPRTAVENQLVSPGTYTSTRQGRQGLVPIRVEQLGMGRILRTDRDIMYGPLGAPQGARLIETFQAVLRLVGTRWNMPEWMISGDASNNNMASSITAGSAFDVSSQARQKFWGEIWVDIALKAMRMMGVDVDELMKLARLTAKGSQVAARDEVQDEQIRDIRNKAGVLSKRTWANEAGLDYDEEQANIDSEPQQAQPMLGPDGQPIQPPDEPSGEQPPPFSAGRTEGLAFSVAEAAIREQRRKRHLREEDDDVEMEDGDHWVTINGNHVLLSGDGTVRTGRFRGQNIAHLSNEDVEGHTAVSAEVDKRATVRTQKAQAQLDKPKAEPKPEKPAPPKREGLREKYRELAKQVGFVEGSSSSSSSAGSAPGQPRGGPDLLTTDWDVDYGSAPVQRTASHRDAITAHYSSLDLRRQYPEVLARTPDLSEDTRDRLKLLDAETRASRHGRPDTQPWSQTRSATSDRWTDVMMRVTDHPGVEGIDHYRDAIEKAIGPDSGHYNEAEYNAVMDSVSNWRDEARRATRNARQVRLGQASQQEQDEHTEEMARRKHLGDWIDTGSGHEYRLKFDTPKGKFTVYAQSTKDNASGALSTDIMFTDPQGSTARTENVGEYSHAVFNGVKASLAAWFFEKKPDLVSFTGAGETRVQLYDLLASTATKFGDEPYRAFASGSNSYRSYYIVKSKWLEPGSPKVPGAASLYDKIALGDVDELGGRVRRTRDPAETGILLDDAGHRIPFGTPEYEAARRRQANRREAAEDEWVEFTDDPPEDIDTMKFWREFEKKHGPLEPEEPRQDKTEAFCPTGPDGGQDNSCPPGNKGTGELETITPRGKIDKVESLRLVDAVRENDGFTYQPVDDSTPTKGFVVSHEDGPIVPMAELTPEKIYEWLKANADQFDADPELHAGGWVHEGEVHLDLVKVLPDEASATKLGIANNQYAIWDLENKRQIDVESERTKAARAAKLKLAG